MPKHAILSPSSASRWMVCAGAPRMERGLPDSSSEYADEGTAAHFLAAQCLTGNKDPMDFFKREIVVHAASGGAYFHQAELSVAEGSNCFTVDEEMVGNVRLYTNGVHAMAHGGTLQVEWSLPIGHITGEEGAEGTVDAVAVVGTTLKIRDLKYGRGNPVPAEGNRQLMIYALAAYDELALLYDIQNVEIGIHQPRVEREPDVHVLTVTELEAFRQQVKERGYHALEVLENEDEGAVIHHLKPGDEQCKWCKAKAKCPALGFFVQETVVAQFEDLAAGGTIAAPDGEECADLAIKLAAVDLIESWCAAVRAEAYRRANAGTKVPGFKLVAGKKGARAWANEEEAETLLKSMRIKHDEMYQYKVISPTQAEKLAKAEIIGKRQWPKLQALITQGEGKPALVPESDKRPALATPGFEDLEAGGDLV